MLISPCRPRLTFARAVILLRTIGVLACASTVATLVRELGDAATAIAAAWRLQFLPNIGLGSRLIVAVGDAWDWRGVGWWLLRLSPSLALLAIGLTLVAGDPRWLRWMIHRLEGESHE